MNNTGNCRILKIDRSETKLRLSVASQLSEHLGCSEETEIKPAC